MSALRDALESGTKLIARRPAKGRTEIISRARQAKKELQAAGLSARQIRKLRKRLAREERRQAVSPPPPAPPPSTDPGMGLPG